MASNKMLVQLAVAAVFLSYVAVATEHWVGDANGWTINFDYQEWAKGKEFKVGDTLVFNYTEGKHNVYKVDKDGFNNCVAPAENKPLTSGRDVIPLATAGKKWYICGVGKHCSDLKQKLAITVEAGAPAPAADPPSNSAHGIVYPGHFVAAAFAVGMIFFV